MTPEVQIRLERQLLDLCDSRESVVETMAHVRWAEAELEYHRRARSPSEVRAEQQRISTLLRTAAGALRDLSPDLEAALGGPSKSQMCAEQIEGLLPLVDAAGTSLQASHEVVAIDKRGPKLQDREHAVAVEMAVRVLDALKRIGIPPSATSTDDGTGASVAVRVLKAIGVEIDLDLAFLTWRDTIIEAKNRSPTLGSS